MMEEETFNLEEAFLKLEETIAELEKEDYITNSVRIFVEGIRRK